MLIDGINGKSVLMCSPAGLVEHDWSSEDVGFNVFNIQAIADFLHGHTTPKEAFRGGLMRLPFERCWFEYRDNRGWRYAISAFYESPTKVTLNYFCEEDRLKLSTGYSQWGIELDENGLANAVTARKSQTGLSNYTGAKDPKLDGDVACLHAVVAIYFLNWKQDVITQLNQPTRQQRRHAARTGSLPLKEFHTVTITPWVRKFESMTVNNGGGWEQRWHAVRGHSRTWTEAAPQMACDKCKAGGTGHGPKKQKSHVGTWWIASYFAGNKKLGEIESRYELDLPSALGASTNPSC